MENIHCDLRMVPTTHTVTLRLGSAHKLSQVHAIKCKDYHKLTSNLMVSILTIFLGVHLS